QVLEATEDIVTHLPLIEYVGNVMLRDQYMGRFVFVNVFYSWQPHVLFYSKFGGVDLCVDATNTGNEARFVRRSCTPNAEIQHSLQGNNLRFFIHASKSIIAGAEITIAFDFNYHKCGFAVECACTRSSCPVLK
ncbi:hypothetical protein HELRODRAFT_151907, partial [Helobdella robusta]|uniref:SET domain-containing protein n=1 Tax=Helobdella robusta TaxID=6412 RepID=T1EKM7_HELRO